MLDTYSGLSALEIFISTLHSNTRKSRNMSSVVLTNTSQTLSQFFIELFWNYTGIKTRNSLGVMLLHSEFVTSDDTL